MLQSAQRNDAPCMEYIKHQPQRTLRSSTEKLLKIPKCNLKSAGERSFMFTAPSIWNSLPSTLRSVWQDSKPIFFGKTSCRKPELYLYQCEQVERNESCGVVHYINIIHYYYYYYSDRVLRPVQFTTNLGEVAH